VSATSKVIHEARINASHTNSSRHNKHGSQVDNLEHSDRRDLSRNLDSSFLLVDKRGNIMPKTPKAALIAAQAYLYTTQPTPGDPREHMHRAALQGLRLVGSKLTAREEEPRCNEGNHKPRSPHRYSSPRHRSRSRRSRSSSPKHYNSSQHERTRRSKSLKQAYDYEDDKKEIGASCFTHKVCRTPIPKEFKLPHDQQKYDGSQEPRSWLSDYLQAVRILGGSKETSMQSLHLTGAARFIHCKRIYNFSCSMLVLHQLLYVLFTLRGIFMYFFGTNLLTRCHSASSCFMLFFYSRFLPKEIFLELDERKAKVPIFLT
jgi:hypothetical protein